MLRRLMMAGAASGGDPHWANVVSLLNFIGTDGATSTTDDKGLVWTFAGNAQIDTAASANGTSALLLDGTGDYLQTADDASLRVDVSTFTMEVFFRRIGSKTQCIFGKRSSGSAREYGLYLNTSNQLNLQVYNNSGTTSVNITGATAVTSGAFHHVEFSRSGTAWYLFLDGALEGSTTQTGTPAANTEPLRIGRDPFNTSRDFDGWIGGFRRTNGVARHTSAFTPPPAPFPTG